MKYKFIKGTILGGIKIKIKYTEGRWKLLTYLMFTGDGIETTE